MGRYTWTTVTSNTKITKSILTELINNYNDLSTTMGITDPGNQIAQITPSDGKIKSDTVIKLYQGINNANDLIWCGSDKVSNYSDYRTSQCGTNNTTDKGSEVSSKNSTHWPGTDTYYE